MFSSFQRGEDALSTWRSAAMQRPPESLQTGLGMPALLVFRRRWLFFYRIREIPCLQLLVRQVSHELQSTKAQSLPRPNFPGVVLPGMVLHNAKSLLLGPFLHFKYLLQMAPRSATYRTCQRRGNTEPEAVEFARLLRVHSSNICVHAQSCVTSSESSGSRI